MWKTPHIPAIPWEEGIVQIQTIHMEVIRNEERGVMKSVMKHAHENDSQMMSNANVIRIRQN